MWISSPVGFAQLPAFRHLSPEEYRDRVAELIREIEEEGEKRHDGNTVAGVEKILGRNPFEPPTRRAQRSPKPLFHVASRQAAGPVAMDSLGSGNCADGNSDPIVLYDHLAERWLLSEFSGADDPDYLLVGTAGGLYESFDSAENC